MTTAFPRDRRRHRLYESREVWSRMTLACIATAIFTVAVTLLLMPVP
jgi:hypothetical protein